MIWIIVILVIVIIYVVANTSTSNAPESTFKPPKNDVKSRSYSESFNVGDRAVNQAELGRYLEARTNGIINIRYQSPRKGSSRYWRSMKLVKYDGTYLYVEDNKSHNRPVRYRRDRVIEFK